MEQLKTIQDILTKSVEVNLYKMLLDQLSKDFSLANIDLKFNKDISPSGLKLILQETIYQLIHEKFSDYLNLLYIIDVSEKKIKQLDGSDTVLYSEQVSYLILLREWQKVWYRNNY